MLSYYANAIEHLLPSEAKPAEVLNDEKLRAKAARAGGADIESAEASKAFTDAKPKRARRKASTSNPVE
jgi:hypothetical protein